MLKQKVINNVRTNINIQSIDLTMAYKNSEYRITIKGI